MEKYVTDVGEIPGRLVPAPSRGTKLAMGHRRTSLTCWICFRSRGFLVCGWIFFNLFHHLRTLVGRHLSALSTADRASAPRTIFFERSEPEGRSVVGVDRAMSIPCLAHGSRWHLLMSVLSIPAHRWRTSTAAQRGKRDRVKGKTRGSERMVGCLDQRMECATQLISTGRAVGEGVDHPRVAGIEPSTFLGDGAAL